MSEENFNAKVCVITLAFAIGIVKAFCKMNLK